jgi:tetratricopeptide (TPR) repeat protein
MPAWSGAERRMAFQQLIARSLSAFAPRELPRLWRSGIILAGVLAASLLAVLPARPAPAAAPVKGEVKVSLDGGYARLVFRLDQEVASEVRLADNIVIIAFKQPVDISVDQLSSSAGDYISAARSDPDGLGVRLALKRKVRVNSMAAGERLFVDLLPESWTGVLPGLPQDVVEELARRAREAEKLARQKLVAERLRKQPAIRVHVGKQPTFTRYVFDLPDNVGVSNHRGKDELKLVFDAPLKFDLADAYALTVPAVRSIESKVDTDSVSVRFALAGKVDVRAFREDKTYIVDIGNLDVKKPKLEGLAAAGNPGDLAAAPAAANAPVPNIEAPPTVPAQAAQPKAAAAAAAASSQPAAPVAKKPAAAAAVAPQPAAPASMTAEKPKQAAAKPPAQPQAKPAAAAAKTKTAKTEKAKPAPTPSSAVAVNLVRRGDSLQLTFPFGLPTPAAVFHRADTLWIVFDTKAAIDLAALNDEPRHTIRSAILTRADGAAVVRVKLARPRLISLVADGPAWMVTIGDSVAEPTRPLSLTRSIIKPSRSSVIIPFDEPQRLHRLDDPDIGDKLFVVTALGPARGFLKSQDFVEFRALASTQGVVIQPLADDLKTELSVDKVVISRPSGLTLSAGTYGPGRENGLGPIVLDPQLWGFDRQADFAKRQALLLRKAAEASDNRRKFAQGDLARFYLARGMDAEAKGVLDLALSSQRPTINDVPALVLRAIANIMLGRSNEALRDLSNPLVGDQYDAPLWRAVAQARAGKYGEAREGFKNVTVAMETLPIELQRMALLAAVRSNIEVRDFASAGHLLDELETIGVAPRLQARVAVLSGRLAQGLGRAEDALRAYRRAAESPDRPAAAEGRLRLVSLRYILGDLKRPEVLAELESLTTTWRGDDTEIEALQLMARLYIEAGRYRDAFNVMRTAETAHPNSEITRRIHDEAAATFEALFLTGKGDSLPTIDALSLFYDFRGLTPIGSRGDEMIRRLAERLVSVDLLDQASELLQYQIDHRLQGAARAQVATRLAVIYLMNRKPERALATLRATRTAELSNALRNQRLLIEARALSDMGRPDVALEVIANVPGREAIRLRSDILWAARRWAAAAEQIELMYGDRWQDWKPLSDVARADILRAAVGFALGDDQIGLGRLREKYAAKMADGSNRRAFDVVTSPMGASGAEFDDVAKTVAAVDTLVAFLRDLRARYPETAGMGAASPAAQSKQKPQATAAEAEKPSPIPAPQGVPHGG